MTVGRQVTGFTYHVFFCHYHKNTRYWTDVTRSGVISLAHSASSGRWRFYPSQVYPHFRTICRPNFQGWGWQITALPLNMRAIDFPETSVNTNLRRVKLKKKWIHLHCEASLKSRICVTHFENSYIRNNLWASEWEAACIRSGADYKGEVRILVKDNFRECGETSSTWRQVTLYLSDFQVRQLYHAVRWTDKWITDTYSDIELRCL